MDNETTQAAREAEALADFARYFVRNYPGPNTIIGDPNWHAPKVFRAALYAIQQHATPAPQVSGGGDAAMHLKEARAHLSNGMDDVGEDERAMPQLRECAYHLGMIEAALAHPQARMDETDALGLIAAERQRQITAEGWSPEHDAEHGAGELAAAAACYAYPPSDRVMETGWHGDKWPTGWPWDKSWWKPGDRTRELVKAGALIVAEIERLQRAALTATPGPTT